MPSIVTIWLLSGEVSPDPCTALMGVMPPLTANVAVTSAAMVSGGSFASRSLTDAAVTTAAQLASSGSAVLGVNVKVVGPPVTAPATCEPAQLRLIAPLASATGSENVTVTTALGCTPTAPSAGAIDVTVGAASST